MQHRADPRAPNFLSQPGACPAPAALHGLKIRITNDSMQVKFFTVCAGLSHYRARRARSPAEPSGARSTGTPRSLAQREVRSSPPLPEPDADRFQGEEALSPSTQTLCRGTKLPRESLPSR